MSQLSVASYLMGIPPGNSNPEKPKIIHNFIKGVNACGQLTAQSKMNAGALNPDIQI